VSERQGPHVAMIKNRSFLTCIGCEFLNSKLMKSGLVPEYEMNCTHQAADSITGGFISWEGDVETPFWCPFTKTNIATTVNTQPKDP